MFGCAAHCLPDWRATRHLLVNAKRRAHTHRSDAGPARQTDRINLHQARRCFVLSGVVCHGEHTCQRSRFSWETLYF